MDSVARTWCSSCKRANLAQVPLLYRGSIVGRGVPRSSKEGQPFTIHLEGVGWTQLDNTVTVDYDNSYIGYGCGFNSNGDVLLHLNATGGPGTHLIDLYPLLYTLSPSFAATPYGMVPVLTYAQDEPATGARLSPAGVQAGDHRREVAAGYTLVGRSRLWRPARSETFTPTRRAMGAG